MFFSIIKKLSEIDMHSHHIWNVRCNSLSNNLLQDKVDTKSGL